MSAASDIDFSRPVPIFPLPNAVLLPRAILPLHVFEPRYRAMTQAALEDRRLIAIALLKPGFEPLYHTLDAPIHDDICVGRILREERLADGRFNFLLQGVSRARVIEEDPDAPFRRAFVKPVPIGEPSPEDECMLRKAIRGALDEPPLRDLAEHANWFDLLTCSALSLSDLIDVLASAALPCASDKQCFLAEPCTVKRGQCLLTVLGTLREHLLEQGGKRTEPRDWPPKLSDN